MKPSAVEIKWLWVIVGVATILRTGLALQGGQYFFGDESRFMRSVVFYRSIFSGQWETARQVISSPQHAGFIYVGALICPLANVLAGLLGAGDWSQAANVHVAMPLIASVLNVFSILNVWLVHRVARQFGGTPAEALLAALLAAINSALVYQARHLLPYDSATTAMLCSLLLVPRAERPSIQAAIGGLAGLCFCIYNGYWFIIPALGLLLLYRTPGHAPKIRAGTWFALGAVGGVAVTMGPGTLAGGSSYWSELIFFSGTAYQGVFAEGWSFPWEYHWRAESWLGLVVLGSCLCVGVAQHATLPARVREWLVFALIIYLLLTLCSTGLEVFVVYGRSFRPLLIVLCLLGGYAGAQLLPTSTRGRVALVGAILGLASINLVPHFRVSFPTAVIEFVWSQHGFPKLALSYQGVLVPDHWPAASRPDLALLNPVGIFPVKRLAAMPAGETLVTWRHPHSIPVYLYEGHRPWERRLLLENPPDIRLIKLGHPAETPNFPAREYFLMPEDVPRGY